MMQTGDAFQILGVIIVALVVAVLIMWVAEVQRTVDQLVERDRARGEPAPVVPQGPPLAHGAWRDFGRSVYGWTRPLGDPPVGKAKPE